MEPTPGAARPSRLIVAAVLVAHLLAGIAIGIAIDRFVLHGHGPRRVPFAGEMGRGGPPPLNGAQGERMRAHMTERLVRELDLTPEQRAQVEQMLPRHLAAFDSLRQEMAPRLRALLDSSAAELEAVLTPEQQQRWRKIRRPPPVP